MVAVSLHSSLLLERVDMTLFMQQRVEWNEEGNWAKSGLENLP